MTEYDGDPEVVAALAAGFADARSASVTLLAAPGSSQPMPPAAVDALMDLLAQGRAAWPEAPVDAARMVVHVAHLLPPEVSDLAGALRALCAADLYLAFACTSGVPGALTCLERISAVAVDATIARVDRSPAFRDEVRQALRERLFTGTPDEPARIGTYAGRGPLVAWLAIVARRVALSLRRGEANRARIEDRAMTEALAAGDDPEIDYLKRRYRDQFEAAFRTALEQLPAQDRTMLRLNLVEGMTLDRLGIMFGVNASTVSRWLTRARASILTATEDHLRENLDVSPSEFASLARLVVSQLDVSIAALFDVRVHRS
jgi:RNA polymerase sigma-70 factor (ECF subfamily)